MSAVAAIPSDRPVSEDLRRVAVKSWKAPIIFGIFAVLFTLLPLIGPREGDTTFRLAAGQRPARIWRQHRGRARLARQGLHPRHHRIGRAAQDGAALRALSLIHI